MSIDDLRALLLRRIRSRPALMLIRRPQSPGVAREVSERALRTVGEELCAARLARGEELQDIAAYLRIRPAFLSALEQGDVGATPGRPYAIGFLRSYGDYLGLDGKRLVASLKPAVEAATQACPLSLREPLGESRRPTAAMLVASLLLAGALYAGYHLFTTGSGEPPMQVAEAPAAIVLPPPFATPGPRAAARLPLALAEPEPALADVTSAVAAESPEGAGSRPDLLVSLDGEQGAAPNASEAGAGRVVLLARDPSWIQVRSADRSFVRTRTLQPGERFAAPDRDDLTLSTGNAGGLEILLDGQSVGRAGAPGAVVRNLALAPEVLKQRGAAAP
jgi:cytoskeleton protein RodZ